MHVIIGILCHITRAGNSGVGVRDALAQRMSRTGMDSAVIRYSICRRKSKVTRVKVCPFLP
jgi:hypothetical protein